MDRRRFIQLASSGAAALSMPVPVVRSQPLPDGPNLIVILIEDLNDWVGCLDGHPNSLTPNLDAFAQRGVLFTNAHASAAACNPSRTSLWTGLNPSTTGVYDNFQDWRDLVPESHPTFPRHLHTLGYHTMRSGKVMHDGMEQNFVYDERFPGSPVHNLNGTDPYLPGHPINNTGIQLSPNNDLVWGATDMGVESMIDYRRLEWARMRIAEGRPEPFQLLIGTHKTHWPAVIPRKYLQQFDPSLLELPPVLPTDLEDIPLRGRQFVDTWMFSQIREHKEWRKAVQAYLASITFVDEQIGRFLNAFYDSPYAGDTIVMIAADHGFHLGEKLHWRKYTLWEESTRVYMAWDVPGVTIPGGVCSEPVGLIDTYPTLLDLIDIDPPPGALPYDGVSLRPQLENPLTHRDRPVLSTNGEDNHAVRSDRWRYIQYDDGSEELYDHSVDPNEWTNLAGDPQYQQIKDALADWLP